MCLLYITCFDMGVHCRITKSSSWCIISFLCQTIESFHTVFKYTKHWCWWLSFCSMNLLNLCLLTEILYPLTNIFHVHYPFVIMNLSRTSRSLKVWLLPPWFCLWDCLGCVCYTSLFISMVVNIPVHGYAVTMHDTHLNGFNPSKNPAEVNICVYLSGWL